MKRVWHKSRRLLTKNTVVAAVVVLGLLVCVLAAPALAAGFTDVYSDTWQDADYPEAVNALSDLGIITGYLDGTFRPHGTVLRQQFAKMIVKAMGIPVTGNEVNPFADVAEDTPSSDPFYPEKYVAVCAAHGITNGKTATRFAPYDTITRAQVLSMVVRAAKQFGVELQPPSAAYFAGTVANSTFRNLKDPVHGLNVQTAEMNNLVWGIWPDSGTNWDVRKNATRGEVALILWRLWQRMNPAPTTTTLPQTTTTEPGTTTTTTSTTTTEPTTTTSTTDTTSTTSTTVPPQSSWVALSPSGGDPGKRKTSAVYLSGSDAALVFGGTADGISPLGDMWRYDLGLDRWSVAASLGPKPPARHGTSLVYDPSRGKVIMFGGYGLGYLDDLWEYDPSAGRWTELIPAGAPPHARNGHSMVYDAVRGKVLLFGGYDGGYLNDTWQYDPASNAWTELRPWGASPPARYSHGMVYDPASGKTIVFGGQMSTGTTNDLWEYDPAANRWTAVFASGTAPSVRAGHSMVYDPGSRRVIVFGGRAGVFFKDCWAYLPSAQTWMELQPSGVSPAPRVNAAAVYDALRNRVVLFGGSDGAGLYLGDLWALIP